MAELLGFGPYLGFLFRCYSDPDLIDEAVQWARES